MLAFPAADPLDASHPTARRIGHVVSRIGRQPGVGGGRTPWRAPSGARVSTRITALIAPHAGLLYSGPVAAHAYRQLEGRTVDIVVLVGPSHFVGFDGISIYRRGGFDSPLGVAPIDEACAARLMAASPLIQEHPAAHVREHSLEMQLPFVRRLLPHAAIVPLVVGWQTPVVARELGRALAVGCATPPP